MAAPQAAGFKGLLTSPVLLKVMGQAAPGGRHLGLQNVIELFKKRSFPDRMNQRLRAER